MPGAVDLTTEIVEGAIVENQHISTLHLVGLRVLGVDAAGGFLRSQGAISHEAIDPHLSRRSHDPHRICPIHHRPLQQLDRLQDCHVRRGAVQSIEDQRANGGMHERLQVGERLCIGEDKRSERGAVHRAIRVEHVRAEALGDGLRHRAARKIRLVSDAVGVDHIGAALGEHARHGALATGDITGQADDVASRHQTEEGRRSVVSVQETAPFWYSSCTIRRRESKVVRFRPLNENQITLKSARELDAMRESANRLKRLMRDLIGYTKPGVTAKEIDLFAAQKCKEYELKSGAYGYGHGANRFPGHICVSINEVVVHGIPGPRRVEQGDIVSLDVAVSHRGWFADTCITLPMGEVTPDRKRLLDVCEAALWKGIDAAKPGNRLADIADAIQGYAEQHDFTVVSAFVGHGIGRAMHEPPQVHHCNPPNRGPLLRPGMVICIEPQITPGSGDIEFLSDGWTAVTKDGTLSAHFEHTVAITPNGPEILTSPYDE